MPSASILEATCASGQPCPILSPSTPFCRRPLALPTRKRVHGHAQALSPRHGVRCNPRSARTTPLRPAVSTRCWLRCTSHRVFSDYFSWCRPNGLTASRSSAISQRMARSYRQPALAKDCESGAMESHILNLTLKNSSFVLVSARENSVRSEKTNAINKLREGKAKSVTLTDALLQHMREHKENNDM